MISTHVLDTSRGAPAAGVPVVLERLDPDLSPTTVQEVARTKTDTDGRVRELLPRGTTLVAGRYRLTFGTGRYFATLGVETFYPDVTVVFVVTDATQHYHVPLLVSPFGYSTYRGT